MTETLEREGVEKFADSFAELLEGIRATSRRARRGLSALALTRVGPPSSSSASGRATRRSGRAATRAAGSAGSTSPCACRSASPELETFAEERSRRRARRHRPLRHGRLEPCARGAPAHVRKRELPRPRHDPPGRDPRASSDASTSPARSSSSLRSRASTLETRCHLEYFWEKVGRRPRLRRGHRPRLGARARSHASAASAPSSPASRRSAAATRRSRSSGWSRPRSSASTSRGSCERSRWRCLPDRRGQPGLELGDGSAAAGTTVATRSSSTRTPGGFGLWAEQLIAESTGKEGQGLVPVPGESRRVTTASTRRCGSTSPYELGQEFYRWEFATAVAGAVIGDQPVRPAERSGGEGPNEGDPRGGGDPALEPEGEPFAGRRAGRLLRAPGVRRADRRERAAARGAGRARARARPAVVTTAGFGPRYLHSTGQLHKGGPPTGLFLQVVDDTGESCRSPAATSASAA